jgi:hypothetical protein
MIDINLKYHTKDFNIQVFEISIKNIHNGSIFRVKFQYPVFNKPDFKERLGKFIVSLTECEKCSFGIDSDESIEFSYQSGELQITTGNKSASITYSVSLWSTERVVNIFEEILRVCESRDEEW